MSEAKFIAIVAGLLAAMIALALVVKGCSG